MNSNENRNRRLRLRVDRAFETQILKFILRSFGREDILGELLSFDAGPEPYGLLDAFWNHPRVDGSLPMKIEAWSRQCQPNEPKFVELLQQLIDERPQSALTQFLLPDWEQRYTGELGVGVVVPYRDETVIIHTWPGFSQGKPKKRITLANGCGLEMHRAFPFLMDYANEHRIRLADEGSELYERIEAGWDFDCEGEGTWEESELRN